MERIEKSGKTVEEAIEAALQFLGADRDQVDIEILDEGSKGFFSIGARAAKVGVTKKHDPVAIAKSFLRQVFAAMGAVVEIGAVLKDNKQLYIDLKGENIGILIGKRGQTLDSLQYLVNLVVNKGEAQFVSVHLDSENYRQRRKETLESLAINLAKKVKITKKSVVLEPMNPYERRIIHSYLQNDKYISTHSEGEEPFRYVVITPKKQQANREHRPYKKDKMVIKND